MTARQDEQALKFWESMFGDAVSVRHGNYVMTYEGFITRFNSEVLAVLEELESKRGILSDPVHGEKSVPLSAIATIKERYM